MCQYKIFFASLIPSFLSPSFHLFFLSFRALTRLFISVFYYISLFIFMVFLPSSLHLTPPCMSVCLSFSVCLSVCLSLPYSSYSSSLVPSLLIYFSFKVIGDKQGGNTALALSQLGSLDVLEEIHRVVKVPMKFIHVHRNPFDNIATMVLRATGSRSAVREEGIKVSNVLGSITLRRKCRAMVIGILQTQRGYISALDRKILLYNICLIILSDTASEGVSLENH